MAIIQNKATEDGDVIFIKTDIPLIGIVALLSFVDDVEETVDTTFNKFFRYSLDGITWTPFTPLTVSNVSVIDINITDTLYLEYRYERDGDSASEISFNSVTLDGTFQDLSCGNAFAKSMFGQYLQTCNNVCSITWSINVLEKVYRKGLLADYIDRNKSSSNSEDRDFIDFWRSITHYFALYVCLGRYFANFYKDKDLVLEFMRQRNLFICDDASIDDITYLMNYYYDEVRQRGTIQIAKKKGSFIYDDISVSGSSSESCLDHSISEYGSIELDTYKEVDGELLRLICYNIKDEFIFNLRYPEYAVWNLTHHSPLNKSLTGQVNAIKGFETTKDFKNLKFYHIHNDINVFRQVDGDKTTLRICDVPVGEQSGIGTLGTIEKPIIVDQNYDYEITFFAKHSGASPTFGQIFAGVLPFDEDNNLLSCIELQNTTASNVFFSGSNINPQDKYVFIRLILFRKNKIVNYDNFEPYNVGQIVIESGDYYKAKRSVPAGNQPSLSASYWQPLTVSEVNNMRRNTFGWNLQMPDGTCQIVPQVQLKGGSGSLNIWDFKVRPLATPYDVGFVETMNWIDLFAKNRNSNYNQQQLRTIISRYLLPYNSLFEFVDLPLDGVNQVSGSSNVFSSSFSGGFA